MDHKLEAYANNAKKGLKRFLHDDGDKNRHLILLDLVFLSEAGPSCNVKGSFFWGRAYQPQSWTIHFFLKTSFEKFQNFWAPYPHPKSKSKAQASQDEIYSRYIDESLFFLQIRGFTSRG